MERHTTVLGLGWRVVSQPRTMTVVLVGTMAILTLCGAGSCTPAESALMQVAIAGGTERLCTCGPFLVAAAHSGKVLLWDWDNLPKPPLEASRTTGVAAAVVDGGWLVAVPPHDPNDKNPILVSRLFDKAVLTKWEVGPEWFCVGLGPSSNGRQVAVWLAEDFVITHNPSHPRTRLGVIRPEAKGLTWVLEATQGEAGLVVNKAVPSDDGRFLAVAGLNDGAWILVADVESRRRIWEQVLREAVQFYDIGFSPDGKTLYAGGSNATVYCFLASDGVLIRRWRTDAKDPGACTERITRVAVSPDGKVVAGGSGPAGDVYLWSSETGERLRILRTKQHTIMGLAFSPDSSRLAVTGVANRTIEVWAIGPVS